MSKYGYELKKKIVLEYISGKGGFVFLARKYGIPSETRVKEWVKAYQKLGDKGLHRSRQQKKYTFEYKLHVVELYFSSEVSYQELALQEGINNPPMLTKWVNDFRIAGPDALRPKKKGRKKLLKSSLEKKTVTPAENTLVDTSVERIKQLEDELLKLRIENAYLKELRRLRLEEEALLKKTVRIIHSLRGEFKLKDILAAVGFPKATYMYWQKRFNREDPNKDLEDKILELSREHKDFGYRRMHAY